MNSTKKLNSAMVNWGVNVSALLTPRYWGFFLTAFVLAAGVARKIYGSLDLPQKYSELIVGNIAWSYQNKFHDYAVLYALTFFFFGALVIIAWIAARLERIAGSAAVGRLHDFLLILCLPAVVWLGGLLTSKSTSTGLLASSQLLLFAGLVFAGLLTCRSAKLWVGHPQRVFDAMHGAVLFVLLAGFAMAAIGVAANRLGPALGMHRWIDPNALLKGVKLTLIGSFLLCCGLIVYSGNSEKLLRALRRLVLGAQCFLPLLWLCLIPPALFSAQAGRLVSSQHLTIAGKLIVFGAISLVYLELVLRIKRDRSRTVDRAGLELLSIGVLVGLLLFLKTPPSSLPYLGSDDYHFGEMLVPWWSWSTQGLIPFWDYAPARGLINYFPGMMSSLVFDGTPSTIGATYVFIYAALATMAFYVLAPIFGTSGTFIALMLGPFANGIGEIDIAVSIFIAAFCWGWLRWSMDRWLVAFAVAGMVILLYAPGQGALALMACAPLALAALWRLYATNRRRFVHVLAAILVLTTLLCALTPLGRMLLGALRYGAEQSQINSMAHGVNWSASFGSDSLNAWAFELMRSSFLLVAMWACVVVFKALFFREKDDRRRVLVYALPVLLISLLFVIRAAGRIDSGGSRLGIASAWALSLLLPLLLYATMRVRAVHMVIWVALGALLLPQMGRSSLAGPAENIMSNFDAADADALEKTSNARDIESGRLGSAVAEPAHLARIEAVRRVLDQVLEAHETYVDASGRHAMYFYVDRKPAIESAAIYNLVGERQQLRAIKSIRAERFPAILLSADNLLHDGGPSSLRSNLLYREFMLLDQYKLVIAGSQVWLIRSDRVGRLLPDLSISVVDMDESAVKVLDTIYRRQDLESIPASWGRSARSLDKALTPVLNVASEKATTGHSIEMLDVGRYAITGEDPYVRFDVSESKLSGRQAGLLSFDFTCKSPTAVPVIGLYWTTPKAREGDATFFTFRGHQGRLIVPVDSAPAWLLAPRIDTLRFDIEGESAGCEEFSIQNVALYARTASLLH